MAIPTLQTKISTSFADEVRMQIVSWLRTHIPIRNGMGGITTSFIAPLYQVRLDERVFHIFRNDKHVTSTGMENVAEFTLEGAALEQQEAPAKKSRAKIT